MSTLVEALKRSRRNMYKYGREYDVLIVVNSQRQVQMLFDEVRAILDSSSMQIESARFATRKIKMAGGGVFTVAVIVDSVDVYLYAGHVYQQVIWLYQPTDKIENYVKAFVRSNVVPEEDLRIDHAVW